MEIKIKKIKNITKIKNSKSYDFAVKDVHRIIARKEGSKNAFYTSNCWHPDIEEFITAKQTPGRLTKFNMSVLVSNAFMDAVKNHDKWVLEFPDYEKHADEYKKYWKGDLNDWKQRGYSTVIYKTFDDANELYDLIMKSTYNRNEPGILFVDRMNEFNNLYYCEHMTATNPCGEQTLPIGGACLLGSINLTQFIDIKKRDFDYDKLKKYIPTIVRFMDDVNDITYVPLEIQRENIKNKRRIGVGILGYGSALMMMNIRYGSKEALELTEKLMKVIVNNLYQSSALLAKEKGPFPLFDKDKYLKSKFVQMALSDETKDMIRCYGMRNSHCNTIAPTGNTGLLANNCTGGLEPAFLPEYIRTSIVPIVPNGLDIPKNVDWTNKTFVSSTDWKWIKEGDETMLTITYDGIKYKYDKGRGLVKETLIEDYAVKYLKEHNQWDPYAKWVATTANLSLEEHVNTMKVLSRYIDSSMSKTINLPSDFQYNDFKDLYKMIYDSGTIKGATSYRAGTMTSILSSANKKDDNIIDTNVLGNNQAPKRPKTLPCDINHLKVKGEDWIVLIGLYGDKQQPYEVFAFKKKEINISDKVKRGFLTKVKSGQYDLEINGVTIENIKDNFESNEQEALTRLISLSLRHSVNINYIFEQLQKSEGTIISFSKAIARTLKKYIDDGVLQGEICPNCGKKMVMTEGCMKCINCGYSKC